MDLQSSYTRVKVPANLTQKRVGSLKDSSFKEIDETASLNLKRRGDDDKPTLDDSLLTPKTGMTIGCWNVRTLYSTGALQILLQELERFRWDVMGVAETHWDGVDDKICGGYRVLSSGREDSVHRAGVALILGKRAQGSLLDLEPVNDRIITARFKIMAGNLTICQVYAPTVAAEEKEIEEFYEKLQNVNDRIPKGDVVVMMGDLNAKVGTERTDADGVIGKFGYGQRNSRGDRLIEFCRTNGLCIANTLFKQAKENRSWTWESPCGKYHNQIDFIMVDQKRKGWIKNCRAFPSADVGSDHQLLLAELKMKLLKTGKKDLIRRVDVSRLQDSQIKANYQACLEAKLHQTLNDAEQEDDVDKMWEKVKDAMQKLTIQSLGYKKKGMEKKWLSACTGELIMERRQLKVIKKDDQQKRKHYNYLCRQIKRSAKIDKEKYVNKICENKESINKQNNSRVVYEGIRKITGTRIPRINTVKDKNGVILKGEDEVKSRWKEYFEELYNDPNAVDKTVLSELGKSKEEEKEPGIMMDEVRVAIDKMKKNKSPGIDNIMSEEIQAAAEGNGILVIWQLLQQVWSKEEIPRDWKRAVIVPIHKKRDRFDCNNYRGVSL
jgi:hypothetical protein